MIDAMLRVSCKTLLRPRLCLSFPVVATVIFFFQDLTSVLAVAPFDLSNFQGLYSCKRGASIARASTISAIQTAVKAARKVKAVGVGHSWWKENFCASSESSESSVSNIFGLNEDFDETTIPLGGATGLTYVGNVDARRKRVKVGCGITIRDALNSIEKEGYVLPTFPWFTDQTLCGAIATGTHGSSLKFGSLSSEKMLLEMEVVLANGELKRLTREKDPELFSAFSVNVGRLGVLVSVTVRVEENSRTERHVKVMTADELIEELESVGKEYTENNYTVTESLMNRLDTTQSLWFLTRGSNKNAVWRATHVTRPKVSARNGGGPGTPFYEAEEKYWEKKRDAFVAANETPENVAQRTLGKIQERVWERRMRRSRDRSESSTPKVQKYSNLRFDRQPRRIEKRGEIPSLAAPATSELVAYILERDWLPGANFSKRDALVSQRFELARNAPDVNMYDQYEVAVPLEKAAECAREVYKQSNKIFQSTRDTVAIRGFRAPILLRFVSAEPENLLSLSYDGPKVYWNFEDYLKYIDVSRARRYSSLEPNEAFRLISEVLFSSKCSSGRNHWGKTKDYQTLQNVARPLHEQFDSNWCSFGCVAKHVDPTRKFESLFGVKGWNWNEQKLECGCQRKGNAKFVYDRETCGDWCGNATFEKDPPQKTRDERRRRIY